MSKHHIKVFFPIFFSVAVILGMFIGYKLHSNMPNTKSFFGTASANTESEVLQIIEERYVDSVNPEKLSKAAIISMLQELDPHSVFIPYQKLSEVNEDLEGSFQGIGIEFNIIKDTVHVLNVVEGGPSARAGLEIGDKIIRVDSHNAVGMKDSEAFKKWVKGPKGTEVQLQLSRSGKIFTKKINRDFIPMPSLDAYYMIDKTKGYIRLNRFSNNTYKEFIEALQSLTSKGMKKLILDLRDNGGGILEEAIDIIDELVGGDQMIVYTEGLKNPRKEYKAKRKGIFEDGKIVVMINEGSASASEVIAGALQDLDRATIVGRRSFGKGLVQEQFMLSDGSALRLTTARYFTPLGRSIQKPYDKGFQDYSSEVLERYHNPTSQSADSNNIQKGNFVTSKSGKKLFGGGGITPDVYVPLDEQLLDSNLNIFFRNNMLTFFAYKYFMVHQKQLRGFETFEKYQSTFQIEDKTYTDLLREAGIMSSPRNFSIAQQLFIKERLKAVIGRMVWKQNGLNYVLNASDKTFIKATEILNDQMTDK